MVNTRTPQRAQKGERGAVDVFMLILLTTLVMFAGLAFDVGMLFNAHREATNAAAAAARAGANEVSTNALYDEGIAEIDEGRAESAVGDRVPARMRTLSIDVSDSEIVVVVEVDHEPAILSLFGFDTFTITGEATARVTNGAP